MIYTILPSAILGIFSGKMWQVGLKNSVMRSTFNILFYLKP